MNRRTGLLPWLRPRCAGAAGSRNACPATTRIPRRAVFELVLKLPAKHIARVRAVAPLRPSGSGRVLHERPANAVDYLLDVTDVGIVLRRGSVEGDDPRRERIGVHCATKLVRTGVTGPASAHWSASRLWAVRERSLGGRQSGSSSHRAGGRGPRSAAQQRPRLIHQPSRRTSSCVVISQFGPRSPHRRRIVKEEEARGIGSRLTVGRASAD